MGIHFHAQLPGEGGRLSHSSRRRRGRVPPVPPRHALDMPCDSLLLSVPAYFPGEHGISILLGTGGCCAELDEPVLITSLAVITEQKLNEQAVL